MRKKIAALIISALLIVNLLPVTVFAGQDTEAKTAEKPESPPTETNGDGMPSGIPVSDRKTGVEYYPLFICGTQVTSKNREDVLGDGMVSYDPDTGTLRLADGTELSASDGENCIAADGKDLTVIAQGGCTLFAKGDWSAINVHGGDLTLSGESFKIGAKKGCAVNTYYRSDSKGKVTIKNCGNIDFSSEENSAVLARGSVTLSGCANVVLTAGSDGIFSAYGDAVIDKTSLYIDAVKTGIFLPEHYFPETAGNVSITDCPLVHIESRRGHAVFAEGSFEQSTYLSGGDVTITDCAEVMFSVGEEGETDCYDALYARGAIIIKNCPSFEISAYDDGITVGHGGMTVENCGLSVKINAGGFGIYDGWIYDYQSKAEKAPGIIIKNCPLVNIKTAKGHAIYVGGVWKEDEADRGEDYDVLYTGTGDLSVFDCRDVVIDNGDSTTHAAVFAHGDVSFANCESVKVISGYEGIFSSCGNVLIDGCDFYVGGTGKEFIYGIECEDNDLIQDAVFKSNIVIRNCPKVEFDVPGGSAMYAGGVWAPGGEDEYDEYVSGGAINISDCLAFAVNGTRGMCSMGDLKLTDCPDVEIIVDHYGLYSNGYGTAKIDNCVVKLTSSKSGICAFGELRMENSTFEVCAGDAGCETYEELDGSVQPWADAIWVYGTLYVDDSSVTAKAGKGEEAFGILAVSMEVTGNSVVNAYGGTGTDDGYCNAVYFNESLTLDGKDVILNLFGGNPDLPEDDPDYYRTAVGTWTSGKAAPRLTVKNGATLNADASLFIYGDVTIDGGTVNVSTPTLQALWCGDYDEEKAEDERYFGTVTVKNGGTLIANTQSENHSAIYANGGINVESGVFFASSAGIEAVSCPQPGRIVFGKDMSVGGSVGKLGYDERDAADGAVTEGYNGEMEEYALFSGDAPALTVYAATQEPHVPDDPITPPTEDVENPGLWLAILIISSVGLAAAIMFGKKEKE